MLIIIVLFELSIEVMATLALSQQYRQNVERNKANKALTLFHVF